MSNQNTTIQATSSRPYRNAKSDELSPFFLEDEVLCRIFT